MGFIEGFPQINGKSVTLTVIDRFSKYARFIPMGHPYIASHSSGMCLHGIPSSIVSDRNLVLKSNFWHKLFSLAGVKLQLPSAFHLQSETTNKIITMYLRCLVRDRPQQWLRWLSWAEFCYNSSFQTSLRTSPFNVVYEREPPSVHAYEEGEARLPAIQQQLHERDEFLAEIKDHQEQSQQQYKMHFDHKHRDVEFQIGD
jgi:hypothetical protein